ncbi:reverse transcriptase [Ancylostoma ceylanicum]|uniref:RNA-directed DNA polymerase n=1 Tax=Ancylostoma ceylanicum TaxID=53326 RepID=A0A0D6L4A1_9BILA|nr:reverse transcriptase [Ancylostoma ceylanicum]
MKRPVAHASLEVVEKEIERLVDMGVIEPITHSEWAAPIVCVRKANGKMRVCADFSTGLNKALEDYEYPIPIPEDIFASLNGGTMFSQIDFSDAYLQVELTDEAKEVVVINTHKGLYRYKRLPFGIKTAPGIFQSIMNKMISGLDGVAAYLDDILVVGKTPEEHKRNLFALFERIAEYGFRVRLEKCSFAKPEIKFLGFIVDREGRRPNPEKVAAISKMPAPQNVSQLRAFLGMVTYYSSFIPNMKELRGPLDGLLKKDARWDWKHTHVAAFERLKKVLVSDLNLTHYDPKKRLIVAADACDYGIGYVISHQMKDGTEKPIAHGSRSLNVAEKNYAQIEKEALALVEAIKKFHKYVYGRHFTLRTDHKPLLAIFGSKKGVPVHSANRLMRWATMLIGYDFDTEYIKTDSFGQADGLSRLIQRHPLTQEDCVIASIEVDVKQVFADAVRDCP